MSRPSALCNGHAKQAAPSSNFLSDPAIASDPVALQESFAALEAARAAVDRLYARWAELEAKQA